MKIYYKLQPDGSFCFYTDSGVFLSNGYPSINMQAIRAIQVICKENIVEYRLSDGTLQLQFVQISDSTIAVQGSLINHTGKIHTISVIEGLLSPVLKGIYQASGIFAAPCGYHAAKSFPDIMPFTSGGMIVLAQPEACIACYVTDHTHYHQAFDVRATRSDLYGFSGDFRLENENEPNLVLPTIYFTVEQDLQTALSATAKKIGEGMQARTHMPPAYHWCSWYYNYSEFNQSQLTEYLHEFPKTEPGSNFRFIQIDAGNCSALGDWLSPRCYWPNGLEAAIHDIQKAGYLPGMWIGPFMVGNHSQLAKIHPDWLLYDCDGHKIIGMQTDNEPKLWGYHDEEYYILDTSHPEAMAYLRKVFRTFYSWGVRMYKTDFMLWGYQDSSKVRRYTPGKTSVEYFRDVLQMIREEIGEESYWLGCISPFLPFIGYADAMRIGGDVGSSWHGQFNPMNMITTVQGNHYTNHRYYQNDPDAIFFRDFHIHLTDSEIEALALYAAISGGCTYTSDPVHLLREDRKKLLSFIQPNGKQHIPQFLYLQECRDEIVVTCKNEETGKALLLIFNPTEKPIMNEYHFSALGFSNEIWVSERSSVIGYSAEPYQAKDMLILKTQPHACRLLLLSENAPTYFCTDSLWGNLD